MTSGSESDSAEQPPLGRTVSVLRTGRVPAEATVARLHALEIDALIPDLPNAFVRLASGGNYRVSVTVPEEQAERARAEVERFEREAAPRVRELAREVSRTLAGATLAAAILAGSLVVSGAGHAVPWAGALWILWVGSWVVRSRARGQGPGSALR